MPKKKAAADTTETPAPKKKHRITRVTKARAVKRRRRNPAPAAALANPPLLTDLTHTVLPGFGAYAGTRAIARVLQRVVEKRWPKLAKHVPAIAGLTSFGGVWLVAHRIERLAPYHDALVMGSAIAAIQNVAQVYLPARYTWLIGDGSATKFMPMAAAPRAIAPASASASDPLVDEYDDAMEANLAQLSQPAQASAAAPVVDTLDDLTGDADDLGIFANN